MKTFAKQISRLLTLRWILTTCDIDDIDDTGALSVAASISKELTGKLVSTSDRITK